MDTKRENSLKTSQEHCYAYDVDIASNEWTLSEET